MCSVYNKYHMDPKAKAGLSAVHIIYDRPQICFGILRPSRHASLLTDPEHGIADFINSAVTE